MKSFLKKIIPKKIFSIYHYILPKLASFVFGNPSRKMIVIGITGTKGKTSTANFIWSVLNNNGIKTGLITTANVKIGEKEIINPFHMTMPGRFILQRFLKDMVNSKIEVAIVEVTSQGIAQFRHIGIDFDVAVFTNISPEHIESHGSFENYKNEKGKLFKSLKNSKNKLFRGKEFGKIIIANIDDQMSDYFIGFESDIKKTFSLKNSKANIYTTKIEGGENGVNFVLGNNESYKLSIVGELNVYNALPAIVIGNIFGLSKDSINSGLLKLSIIPGRMEEINLGQDFKVFVDYAHEKKSMQFAVDTANKIKKTGSKSIILLGAEGGGRDKIKRFDMGEIVGKDADVVISSNVDPYEDDPTPIVEDIAKTAEKFGKKRNENLFVIEDRREGIRKAISLAKSGDVVMITGKGAEQSMIIDGVTIPWDDRNIVREELGKFIS